MSSNVKEHIRDNKTLFQARSIQVIHEQMSREMKFDLLKVYYLSSTQFQLIKYFLSRAVIHNFCDWNQYDCGQGDLDLVRHGT